MISSTLNHSRVYEVVSLKNGSNILIFHDEPEQLRAYFPMQSTHGFFTSSSSALSKEIYYTSDIICFQADHTQDQINRWTADDGMLVDSKYGVGQMMLDGERHLYLTIDGQTLTSERFQVRIPNEIKLTKGKSDFLYDGEQDKPSIYPVSIGSDVNKNFHGQCSREGIEHAQTLGILKPSFDCRLEFVNKTSNYLKASSLFKAQAVFDIDSMSWTCQITSLANANDHRHSSIHEDLLRLYVQTTSGSSALRSNELLLSYQPIFQLLPSTSSLYLSEEHPYQSIKVITLPTNEKYIRVQSSDTSVVRIDKNLTDQFTYTVELPYGAKSDNNKQVYIEIYNTLTGQSQRIQVKVQKRFIDNPIGRIFASLILCASLALIVYGLANRRSSTPAPVPIVSNRSASSSPRVLQAPLTPKRHQLFDDQLTTTTPFDRSPPNSPRTPIVYSNDQPVRLFSAQDIRARPAVISTPRSAMSSMNLLTNDDADVELRLRHLRNGS